MELPYNGTAKAEPPQDHKLANETPSGWEWIWMGMTSVDLYAWILGPQLGELSGKD